MNPGSLPSPEHSLAQRRPDFYLNPPLPNCSRMIRAEAPTQALMAIMVWAGLTGATFPPLEFLSSPAALVCLGCLPAHPLVSSQAQNNRPLIESKREELRVEGQAGAPGQHARPGGGQAWVSSLSRPPARLPSGLGRDTGHTPGTWQALHRFKSQSPKESDENDGASALRTQDP